MASRFPFADPIDLIKANPDNLVGWKAIAAGLGHSEGTVARWHHCYGLPIKRIGHAPLLRLRDLDRWIFKIDAVQREMIRKGTFPRRRGQGGRQYKNQQVKRNCERTYD